MARTEKPTEGLVQAVDSFTIYVLETGLERIVQAGEQLRADDPAALQAPNLFLPVGLPTESYRHARARLTWTSD